MDINRRTKSGITPTMASRIEQSNGRITGPLQPIPTDCPLHSLDQGEFDRWLGDDSPATALWSLLRDEIGIPRVASYKLLARKRPALLPVRDSATDRALGDGKKVPLWWRSWWEALASSPDIVEDLSKLRRGAEAPDLSLLRIADIVIWMRFNKR